ncbi:MAG: DNA polymerase III subunit beta [Proteobacteria bacterium]|nr:DNA polymerase III subunit beta [Pseudomonadota bacterium]
MAIKIKIERSLLNLATSRVQGAMAERSQAQIGLKAQDGRLHVTAADQGLAIFNDLPAQIATEGVVFVPAKLFSDVVRELPDGLVSLETDESFLKILAGPKNEFSMKLPIIDEAQWRNPPEVQYENAAVLPVAKISYMIDQIDSCISPDSTRNFGQVAYLHRIGTQKDTLRLVGTDSFRLSYCDVRTDMPDSFLKTGISLSKRALAELSRFASEGFETVKLSVADDLSTLIAQVPNYLIFIRLSSIKYPNYASVIPEMKQPGVLVSRTHVQGVAKRVLLASDKGRVLQLSFSDSSLTLSSKNIANSEGREKIQLEGYHGPRCDLVINGKYLSDIVSVTASEKLALQFKDSEDPMVLTPYGEPADCRTKHVLVPITGGTNDAHA